MIFSRGSLSVDALSPTLIFFARGREEVFLLYTGALALEKGAPIATGGGLVGGLFDSAVTSKCEDKKLHLIIHKPTYVCMYYNHVNINHKISL